jgi:hypothetical protein
MKTLASWKFIKKNIPMAERYKAKSQMLILSVVPIKEGLNPKKLRSKDTVLVCGDGATLPEDVKVFESFGVDHDVYCINRSMLYFKRPIAHWAAIDAEESLWFSENLTSAVRPENGTILRHTIGWCPMGYDIHWKVNQEFENETQKHVWAGNSGYFGVLTALAMGYKKVILAGMPLDTKPHWYESNDKLGPNWVGQTYRTWIDFTRKHPKSDYVRSLSGYSAFILGRDEGIKEWLHK